MPQVILVNEKDQPLGFLEKMAAHEQGLLHRAFSIFIFNEKGEMLLQQRASGKYHGAGLWTNACCSHPEPGEETAAAAQRRLQEELGFTTPLEEIFDFTYRAQVENGLTEHELDHVFAGEYNGEIIVNGEEVKDHRYASMTRISELVASNPDQYTIWFRLILPRMQVWWNKKYAKTV